VALSRENIHSFLEYKKSEIESISKIESKRLDDLINSRKIVFKYALPVSIVDSVAGAIAATFSTIWIMLPVSIFIIIVYLLATALDRQKVEERVQIMKYTDKILEEIKDQEDELLRRGD
jgi:hypothetical protein